MDPVGLLVRALFSGDLGAEGTVTALRLAVQPATALRKFVCDGEVGYRNLEFRLPKAGGAAEQALPVWLDKLLGAGENLWPRWMQVDTIKSGASGRVAFHMSDGRLNFACDEGPGSAFTGTRQQQVFPPVESLKGSVETDAENRPQRILLRGFLGKELSFETHVEHNADKSRTYQLLLEPRLAAPAPLAERDGARTGARQPLWRFASRVTDYLDATSLPPPDEAGQRAKIEFQVESDARHFPWPEWLPPGMRDISGHMYAKGRFTDGRKLHLDPVCLDEGGTLVYGGEPAPVSGAGDFGPLWQALYSLFGTRTPWELQDVALRGRAEVQFSPDLRWETTTLKDFTLTSGSLVHAGLTSDLGVASPSLTASHKRDVNVSEITVRAFVQGKWHLRFSGDWKQEEGQPSTGTFRLVEQDVPFVLHPQRGSLETPPVSPDKRRVNRTTVVRVNGNRTANEEKF
ncbi:MAG: hypothetical protein NTW87_29980 [Planctomycetota bacterium]|nr:hypothetical protein [Planctomycetota bacterium]